MPYVKCANCYREVWVESEGDGLAFCCDSGDSHITIRDYLANGCRSIEVSDELVNAQHRNIAEYRETHE